MKREMDVLVIAKDKTVEVSIDGKLRYKNKFEYAEHAISYGQSYAEHFAHHEPTLRIDMTGVY